MSRISEAFKNKKAFIPFITCGFPDLDTTKKLIYILAKAGASVIELGIPFSDPMAEGPVIMNADLAALDNGTNTEKILDMVCEVRKDLDIPLVLMTYANVVFSNGIEKFIRDASGAGVDGMILADVPYEEKGEFDAICKQNNMDFISLIAPTSNERISDIAGEAEGFLYCVSSLGVTGVRREITTDIKDMVRRVREVSRTPVAVGFGISTPEQAANMAKIADGVIVGSAIVQICTEYGRDCIPYVEKYAKEIVDAIKE